MERFDFNGDCLHHMPSYNIAPQSCDLELPPTSYLPLFRSAAHGNRTFLC